MKTVISQLGSLLTIILLVAASGIADDAPVVFRKSISISKAIVVREFIREEHRGPTKAEQALLDKLNQQYAENPKTKDMSAGWIKDCRVYLYTATIEDSLNAVHTVWEKEVLESISPNIMWTERLIIRDVAAKNDSIAIVYSSIRETRVDVLKLESENRYVLEYTQTVYGFGTEDVTEAKVEWLEDLHIHILVRRRYSEVWKVRKDSIERVGRPVDLSTNSIPVKGITPP